MQGCSQPRKTGPKIECRFSHPPGPAALQLGLQAGPWLRHSIYENTYTELSSMELRLENMGEIPLL